MVLVMTKIKMGGLLNHPVFLQNVIQLLELCSFWNTCWRSM